MAVTDCALDAAERCDSVKAPHRLDTMIEMVFFEEKRKRFCEVGNPGSFGMIVPRRPGGSRGALQIPPRQAGTGRLPRISCHKLRLRLVACGSLWREPHTRPW